MSLVTRCPRCKTLFRVAPAQLQAHAGEVRCGRCMNVFDGFQALAIEQPSTGGGFERVASEQAALHHAPAAEAAQAPGTAPAHPQAPPAPRRTGGAPGTAPAPARSRMDLVRGFELTLPAKTWLAAGCALLAFVLVAHSVFVFRGAIASHLPAARPALTALCDALGCALALPQRLDLVRLVASDVHVLDPKRPSLIQVTATLRSDADERLAYPALDLVLTNANDHTLARRVFMPREYLGRTRDPNSGIPPRGEFTVALDLDIGELRAAGWRMELIAVPAP